MHPQATVDAALRLSAIGILDKENALICGVSVAAIRHWRAGRRRVALGKASFKRITCPRCHARPLDEPAYSYLLGLYLGDGHIARGPRDVYVLAIACCDDWPGLMAAARQALSAVMPASSVSSVKQTGCTMVKSYSKHWTCLFPQHGPRTQAPAENRTGALARGHRAKISGRIRQGIVPFRWLAWREPRA